MKQKILILEDCETYSEAYKNILKDYDLKIFNTLEEAISYLNDPDFANINLAILDINLGKGFKITGFNFAYKLLKKSSSIPLIICTSYNNREEVKKYAKIINAKILVKPVGNKLVEEISKILESENNCILTEIDPYIKSFMSSGIYVKHLLTINYRIPQEYNDTFANIESLEEYVIDEYEKIRQLCEKNSKINDKSYITEFKNNVKEYVTNLLFISKSIILSQIDIDEEDNKLIDELSEIGQTLIDKLDTL